MIDEWLSRFYPEHVARHPRIGLPDMDTEDGAAVYKAWRTAMVHRGLTDYDVLTTASERLIAERLGHSSEHFPRLCEMAVEIYRDRQAKEQGGDASTRDAARAASRGCPHCGGEGLATVWHPQASFDRKIPESISAHCVCAHGRWMRRRVGEQDQAMLRRIPDFAAALSGQTAWLIAPPDPPIPPRTLYGPTRAEQDAEKGEREEPSPEVVAADPILSGTANRPGPASQPDPMNHLESSISATEPPVF